MERPYPTHPGDRVSAIAKRDEDELPEPFRNSGHGLLPQLRQAGLRTVPPRRLRHGLLRGARSRPGRRAATATFRRRCAAALCARAAPALCTRAAANRVRLLRRLARPRVLPRIDP